MSVERRYYKRHPMTEDVYIRYRKQQVFPAEAVNCSSQGIFLRTRSLTMISGAVVELEFYFGGRHWSVMGIVSHTQPDGVGVMFWRPQCELYDAVIAASSRTQSVGTLGSLATEAIA